MKCLVLTLLCSASDLIRQCSAGSLSTRNLSLWEKHAVSCSDLAAGRHRQDISQWALCTTCHHSDTAIDHTQYHDGNWQVPHVASHMHRLDVTSELALSDSFCSYNPTLQYLD